VLVDAADNVYELFEFFLNNYKNTSKEKLLELMKDAPDIEALRQMEQIDRRSSARKDVSLWSRTCHKNRSSQFKIDCRRTDNVAAK